MLTIKYYGVEGTGRTITDAKKDAGSTIETALSGDYTPTLIAHGEWCAIVARSPLSGWGYRLIETGKQGRQDLYLSGSVEHDKRVALSHVARHLAQLSGTYAGLERYLDRADMGQLDSYFAWQSRYAVAKAEGKTDDECRAFADAR